MVIKTDDVLASLKTGVPISTTQPYTLDTMLPSRIFKSKQPEFRRRYPSIEMLETPQSQVTAEEKTDLLRVFEIRIFIGLRGGTSTSQEDEISKLEVLEQEILTVMNNTVLGEHKIKIRDKQFKRKYENEALRPHILSTLTITIREVSSISNTPDGVLTYITASSTADNKPTTDYQYSNIYNVDVSEGHTDVDEFVTSTTTPQRFTGDFFGTFIGHIKVLDVDLGVTSDKLNELKKIQSNGEKQIVSFKYTNKTQNTSITVGIQRDLKMTIDSINEMYRVGDNTVFRILGKLTEPSVTIII